MKPTLCHNATSDTVAVSRNLACGNLTELPVDIDVDIDAGASDGGPGQAVLAVHSAVTGKAHDQGNPIDDRCRRTLVRLPGAHAQRENASVCSS
jgi:hypothetical protein